VKDKKTFMSNHISNKKRILNGFCQKNNIYFYDTLEDIGYK